MLNPSWEMKNTRSFKRGRLSVGQLCKASTLLATPKANRHAKVSMLEWIGWDFRMTMRKCTASSKFLIFECCSCQFDFLSPPLNSCPKWVAKRIFSKPGIFASFPKLNLKFGSQPQANPQRTVALKQPALSPAWQRVAGATRVARCKIGNFRDRRQHVRWGSYGDPPCFHIARRQKATHVRHAMSMFVWIFAASLLAKMLTRFKIVTSVFFVDTTDQLLLRFSPRKRATQVEPPQRARVYVSVGVGGSCFSIHARIQKVWVFFECIYINGNFVHFVFASVSCTSSWKRTQNVLGF